MSEIINGINVPFLPVGGVEGLKQKTHVEVPSERSFESVFQKELQELKFSKHAQQRLDSRNIKLSDQEKNQLEHAVTKADLKGAHESLVLMKDLAFVVNVKNRTIITAITKETMADNVFTNIDSAIIVPTNS